jgi:hypothetical protein
MILEHHNVESFDPHSVVDRNLIRCMLGRMTNEQIRVLTIEVVRERQERVLNDGKL